MTYSNLYAQPSDLVGSGGTGGRYDARMIADLVSDSNQRAGDSTDVASMQAALASNPSVNQVLGDATSLINSFVLQGQRYTVADLQSLTGVDSAILTRLCCGLAYGLLELRRGQVKPNEMPVDYLEARELLNDLRDGKEVFNLLKAQEAGVANSFFPSASQYATLNLFRDRNSPNYYPSRPPQS